MEMDFQKYVEEYILKGLMSLYKDDDYKAYEIIKPLLSHPNKVMRKNTYYICNKNNFPISLKHTFEPPTKVYKKCLFGIIVVAEIPKTAQVRGKFGNKCRATEAIITNVIGGNIG